MDYMNEQIDDKQHDWEQIDDKQPSFNCMVRGPLLVISPLNCLKTGTNMPADLFLAEQIHRPELIRCYASPCLSGDTADPQGQ